MKNVRNCADLADDVGVQKYTMEAVNANQVHMFLIRSLGFIKIMLIDFTGCNS